jgi:hypothetical protein
LCFYFDLAKQQQFFTTNRKRNGCTRAQGSLRKQRIPTIKECVAVLSLRDHENNQKKKKKETKERTKSSVGSLLQLCFFFF